MLSLNGASFTTGRAIFLDQWAGHTEPTAKVFVRIALKGFETIALVDTGAAYSVLEAELADQLGLLEGDGERISYSTCLGKFFGRLERVELTLLADDGQDLSIEVTMFVSSEWPGRTFLGYSGLLEHMRIAIDPPVNHFYFGASG